MKRENQRINNSLDELQRYKDEYKNLIEELSRAKESHNKKREEFEEIENTYKAELDRLVKRKAFEQYISRSLEI